MTSALSSLSLAQRLAGVSDVACVTADLNGVPRGKVMTQEGFIAGRRLHLARGVLLQCIMGGYPEPEFYGHDDGDLVMQPVTGQIHRLPWAEARGLVICQPEELDGGACGLSSRALLARILERYAERGWQPVVATELEFYLFDAASDPQQSFLAPRGIGGQREPGISAFSVGSANGLQAFFAELKTAMDALGIPRDTFMNEMGLSQFELNFVHGDALQVADQTFLFKFMLSELALKHGLKAVCMAKPLADMPGSSMHVHQSIVARGSGKNIFTDPGNDAPTFSFQHYIGGQQAHLADLTALLAPHVNSYQRYYSPYASPNSLCWSADNRMAGLRVPHSEPADRRVENRLPGADANPYLAIAASLAAGLQGIEDECLPAEEARGEFIAPDELLLPVTLHQALHRLQRSRFARDWLGDEFVDGFLATKRMELDSYMQQISPWERTFLGSQV
ncbi:MAG: glutamine synthetase [Pseudomonadaceae bacterium]|nr:MAG: glutamine synthetase [Pseudomonadaceae bacterium]